MIHFSESLSRIIEELLEQRFKMRGNIMVLIVDSSSEYVAWEVKLSYHLILVPWEIFNFTTSQFSDYS